MPEQPPYRAYATIAGTFMAGLGAVSGLAAARKRTLQEMAAIDLVLLGLATFKASRTVARDRVTSFVREPFVEGEAYEGEGERPTHESEMKQAIGELVTCTRCIGTWIGAGLASTQILAPRTGRLHQIRRHLKHIACPLIGDVKYGKGEHNRIWRESHRLERLALHASRLTFPHPTSEERVVVESALPADMALAIESARAAYGSVSACDSGAD